MSNAEILDTLEEVRHLYNIYLALLEFYRVCQTDKPDKNYKSFYDYRKEFGDTDEEGNQHNEV